MPSSWSSRMLALFRITELMAYCIVGLPFTTAISHAAESASHTAPPVGAAAAPASAVSVPAQYCASILDKAADARFALQRAELAKLQKAIEARLEQLERKRAEFETWTKRREDFLSTVRGNLSTIYAKMKPAAAAEQLAKLDDMTAAAILLKLDPRATSLILAEMDPTKAAGLVHLFAAAGRSSSRNTP